MAIAFGRRIQLILVVMAGLLFSGVGALLIHNLEDQIAHDRFISLSDKYFSVINDNLLGHEALVHAVGGLFGAVQKVGKEEFDTFVRTLLPHSSPLEMVQWLPIQALDETFLPERIDPARILAFSDHHGSEPHIRAEFSLIALLSPEAKRTLLGGVDIAFIHRDVHDGRQVGFELDTLLPVFIANPPEPASAPESTGLIWGHVEVDALLESGVTRFFKSPGGIDITVVADTLETGREIVYHHASRLRSAPATPPTLDNLETGIFHAATIAIDGFNIRVITRPVDLAHFAPLSGYASWFFAAAGLLVTTLLFLYLRAVTGHLEAVREMAGEQKRLRQEAERANREKSLFFSSMSHEIRTPLNGIIGMTELLRDTALDERQKDHLTLIEQSGRVLMNTINNVLDFSKIEAGGLSLERTGFKLRALVAERVSLFGQLARRKGVALHWNVAEPLPDHCIGDPHHLGQILNNLLGNAIKFTERGTVSLEVTAGEGAMVVFCVRDSGVGMNEAALQRIFQPFTQADDSVTRRFGGTGLGLSITRRLAEGMGGDIRVESQPGQGSTFTVRVPLARDEDADPAAVAVAAETPGPLPGDARLLLVEDDPINRKVLAGLLRKLGLEAVVAVDGEQAMERLRQDPFDLVLLDCQLPGIDGYTVCRRFREHEKNNGGARRTPVVALTAHAMQEDRERCLASGMDDHISKPVDMRQFHLTLNRWLVNAGDGMAARA